MAQKSVYSFLDCNLTLVSIGGGIIDLGAGNGSSQEGITIERSNDKATMTIGADGSGMHNLMGDKSGKITVRLLKTSPTNKKLSIVYNATTLSSAIYGQDVMTFVNTHTGETHTATGGGIAKFPNSNNANEGGVQEWVWNFIEIDSLL
jgi:hypothetical protein